MRVLTSSLHLILTSISAVFTLTTYENLNECPLLVPVSGCSQPAGCARNRILEVYDITIQNEPEDDESLLYGRVAFYQSIGCNGNRSLYVQLLPSLQNQSFPEDETTPLYLVISKKKHYNFTCKPVPLFYTLFGSLWELNEDATTGDQIVLEAAEGYGTTPYAAYAVIVELGHAIEATYGIGSDDSDVPSVVSVELVSDILSPSCIVSAIIPSQGSTTESAAESETGSATVTASSTYVIAGIPSNKNSAIACIRRLLRKSAVSTIVPGKQISKMSFTAFLDEVRSFFRCGSRCCTSICDNTVFIEYASFVTSSLQLITASDSWGDTPVVFCGGSTGNTCGAVNQDICRCGRGVGVDVGVQVGVLFGDVCTTGAYTPVVTGVEVTVDVEVETLLPSSCDESTVEEKTRRKVPAQKRRGASVKTSTRVSTYGWYVAGGIVAVSVAVVVYVFVL